MSVYSEHFIASLQTLVQGAYPTGEDVDAVRTRVVVRIGGVVGAALGYRPSDAALAWQARTTGVPAPPGTRAAIHILPNGLVAVGLGPGRGMIETTGDRLVTVAYTNPARYTGAWRLPTIQYGGLI